MFHISWWFLTGVIVYPLVLILIVFICHIIDWIIAFICALTYKFTKNEKFLLFYKNLKIIDYFCEKINKHYMNVNYLPILCIICFLIIPANNFVYMIRCDIKEDNDRIEANKNYLKDKSYNYYKISAANSDFSSDSTKIYYIYTEKSIEELVKEQYVIINENKYVRPYAITKITLDEFVKYYTNIIK